MSGADAQLIAALMSAIAAIAAAVATWRGPIAAARLSEQLRQLSEAKADGRRFKLKVFATIMQERATIYSADGVRALNSIDVAFSDCESVREAWAELYQVLNTNPLAGLALQEKIRRVLKEMASDLGIADRLRLDDFGRVYFPTALEKERQLQELQREAALKQLLNPSQPATNSGALPAGKWPPKPD